MANVTFKSSTLQTVYNGTNSGAYASSDKLAQFRVTSDAGTNEEIASLDARIASFESVVIGTPAAGKSTAQYPYDKASLKREFLDEVVAALMKRGTSYANNLYTISPKVTVGEAQIPDPLFKGFAQTGLAKNATTGWGDFDELNTANATIDNDPRLQMLTEQGQQIFKSYFNLIDQVFAAGESLGNNPAQPVEMVSATQPIEVGGRTYDRVAQVNGLNGSVSTYLLESTATTARFEKNAAGEGVLNGQPNPDARRILIDPVATTYNAATDLHTGSLAGLPFSVQTTSTGIILRLNFAGAVPTTPFGPLVTNVRGREAEFPDVGITWRYKYTGPTGNQMIIGAATDGTVYAANLEAKEVGTVANLNGLEYLLYWNDARIKILRGQLAYREAIVREIQDDLKRANAALSELEVQAGSITATNDKGEKTYQYAAETLNMTLFNATNSIPGSPIFLRAGNDSIHGADEWASNRLNLKNYIDRKSSEAQEATLDYQNTLNRFNNALEVMAKLQEKLDTLLKGQLRNLN